MSIMLVGLGGIGSWTALMLSRLDPAMLVFVDNDSFEEVNLSGQFVMTEHMGLNKTSIAVRYAKLFSGYQKIACLSERFIPGEYPCFKNMICGLDSMAARKTCFERWLSLHEGKHCFFIDGRLAAERLQVFCVRGDNPWSIEEYKKFLFRDADVPDAPCSYKQTSHFAALIAALITNRVTQFAGTEEGDEGMIPFLEEYDGFSNVHEICHG
jgi:molybdopterin/thiamine biosynthesis adenylyltransferase